MDEFDDLLEDEDETPETKPDNASAAKARIDRQKAKLQKELDELKAWKVERERADRDQAVKAALEAVGVDMRSVNFYQELIAAEDPAAALPSLKQKYLGEEEEATPAPQAGFTPTVFEEATPAAAKRLTRQEWEDVMRENPARATALAEAGKVKWNYNPT